MKSLDLSHLPDDEFFLIPPSALPRPSSSFFISYEAPSEDDLDAMEMEAITSSFQPSEDTTFQFISCTRRNRSRITTMGNEGDAAQSTSRRTVSSRFQNQSLLISFVTMDIYSPTTTPSPEHKISPAARRLTPTRTDLHSLPPPVRRDRGRPSCSVESHKLYSCSIAELSKALDLSHVPDDEFFLLPPKDLPQPRFAFFTSEDPSRMMMMTTMPRKWKRSHHHLFLPWIRPFGPFRPLLVVHRTIGAGLSRCEARMMPCHPPHLLVFPPGSKPHVFCCDHAAAMPRLLGKL